MHDLFNVSILLNLIKYSLQLNFLNHQRKDFFMKKIKNYRYVFIAISLISQIIYAYDNNELGTTKLIKFVEQREKELVNLNDEINQLMKQCFSNKITKEKTFGAYKDTMVTTYWINKNCSYDTLKKLYDSRQCLKDFENDTKKQIAKILQDGVSIGATDNQGRTALSYSKSRDVYNALRSQGAPFQIDSFSAVNKSQLLVIALLATVWGFFIEASLNSSLNVNNKPQNASINFRDGMGRTSLMNYIIQKEAEIDLFRESLSNLTATGYLLKIKSDIKQMFELGADFSMKDYEGKTVMDYCKTIEIYDYLCSFERPFSLEAWLHNNQNYITCMGMATAVVLLAVVDSTNNIQGQDSLGKLFDGYFEKI